ENKERFVKIKWQDDFTTNSRFIYYGSGTRNEYRITHFGKGFPYLRPEHTGDLFVLVKCASEDYSAYILETDDEINCFLDAFGMSPADTGALIQKEDIPLESKAELALLKLIESFTADFPSSLEMSGAARRIYNEIYDHEENIILDPDLQLYYWIDMEYRLFRKIEYTRYSEMITRGFSTVEEFIEVANMVLNRRKSRAGKSLEHHLAAIFDGNRLPYTPQPVTEGNKHPDFIFPGENAYHNMNYPSDSLVFLGAKTTCKDRWRQIINEANRIGKKHLFTLQQGISSQQLDEMASEHVTLVVPRLYMDTFPAEKRSNIWTLHRFIAFVKEKTGK
ncbi:MAG: type II restriction endonuclease, partial [Eubacteriales bacterium]|nr:type II restriction endonuclease [Eubacteriales bacterium]